MLRPREDPDQQLVFEQLRITPEPARIEIQRDAHGNFVAIAQFDSAWNELCFDSEILVARQPSQLQLGDIPLAGLPPFSLDVAPDDLDLKTWARRFVGRRGRPGLAALAAMNAYIHRAFAYRRRLERGVQSPEQTLALRSGACRDFAVLLVAAARSLGLTARFVSGYAHCALPDDGSRTPGGGGHTHAWAQVLTPEAGWIDFDPTAGRAGPYGLIRVAVADDPAEAIPIQGVYLGDAADFLHMQVEVAVEMAAAPANSHVRFEPSPKWSVA